MYEMALEHQFAEDVAAGFVAYYKDVYSLAQIQRVLAIPKAYWIYTNVDYANVKGIEVNLKKQMSGFWGLGCSYTLQFAKGTGTWAGEAGYEQYYQKEVIQAIDYWLDYDERHTVIANVEFSIPKDYIFLPLQNFNGSVVFSYHSGHPYTPLDLRGNRLGDVNSARMPGYWNIDLRFSRAFNLGPLTLILDGIVFNLFNTEQILYVYETTGKPDGHGDPEPNLDEFGYLPMTSVYYSPQADYNHDGLISPVEHKRAYIAATKDYYENPMHYNKPFRMRFGISMKFQ
jgi:outer membrane receptor protein involved in Fe transport